MFDLWGGDCFGLCIDGFLMYGYYEGFVGCGGVDEVCVVIDGVVGDDVFVVLGDFDCIYGECVFCVYCEVFGDVVFGD